jgi:hypothetical protein
MTLKNAQFHQANLNANQQLNHRIVRNHLQLQTFKRR